MYPEVLNESLPSVIVSIQSLLFSQLTSINILQPFEPPLAMIDYEKYVLGISKKILGLSFKIIGEIINSLQP